MFLAKYLTILLAAFLADPSSVDAIAPSTAPTAASTITCPNDVKLIRTDGTTEYQSAAVEIISQDTTTVEIRLTQAWHGTVDKYFYEYRNSIFQNTCFEKDNLPIGEHIDDITVHCNIMSPKASLTICLQDTCSVVLTPEDKGTVPQCCHTTLPEGSNTVCYKLEINCETECGSGGEARGRHLRAPFV